MSAAEAVIGVFAFLLLCSLIFLWVVHCAQPDPYDEPTLQKAASPSEAGRATHGGTRELDQE